MGMLRWLVEKRVRKWMDMRDLEHGSFRRPWRETGGRLCEVG